ncbi:MAG: hypothetical protein LBR98_07575 [Syntrophomonadaceae bacterium]|nr:hypothetical protein [Syntrophomonadaceae bacterium]
MAQLLEVFMILSFGAAWPLSIIKSLQARTAKGKSIFFLLIVELGYICGIVSKFVAGNINYVLFFYCLNLVLVFIDIVLYFRNSLLDRKAHGASVSYAGENGKEH